MRHLAALLLPVALLAGCEPGAGSTARPTVEIRAYIPTLALPYTITVVATDQNTGQIIHNGSEPVAHNEYGPALVIYDSGHTVKIDVTVQASANIASHGYLRVWDGSNRKSASSPAGNTDVLKITLYTNR